MDSKDPYRAANILIQSRGKDALAHAAERMVDMKLAGDAVGEAVWGRVFEAIQELQATSPAVGSTVH